MINVDGAGTSGTGRGDDTAIVVGLWNRDKGLRFVVDIIAKRFASQDEFRRTLVDIYYKWLELSPYEVILRMENALLAKEMHHDEIQKIARSRYLSTFPWLRPREFKEIPIIWETPHEARVLRFQALAQVIQEGKIAFLYSDGLDKFIEQAEKFSIHKAYQSDDSLDSVAQLNALCPTLQPPVPKPALQSVQNPSERTLPEPPTQFEYVRSINGEPYLSTDEQAEQENQRAAAEDARSRLYPY